MNAITADGKKITINDVSYPVNSLVTRYSGDLIFINKTDGSHVLKAKYNEITDPDTSQAFASMNALKTFAEGNFFFNSLSVSGSPNEITGIWSGSQAQYDALTPDSKTLYLIV